MEAILQSNASPIPYDIKSFISNGDDFDKTNFGTKNTERIRKENQIIIDSKSYISENRIPNEIEDDFIDDVENIINESLKMKISQAKLEDFLEDVILITKKQVKILINQYDSSNDNQKKHKSKHCQAQFPYKINIFLPSFPPNNYHNCQPPFMMQPIMNSSSYHINPNLQQMPIIQPPQFLLSNQFQYFENFQASQKKKNQINKKASKGHQYKAKAKHKNIKKKVKDTKKQGQKKIKSSNAIDSFNDLPLKSQQSTISEIIKKNSKSSSCSIFSNINNLLIYLLKFKPKSDKHYFSISPKSKETSVEEGIRNLNQIEILDAAVEMLTDKNSLNSTELLNLLSKFDIVSIELKYSSETSQIIQQASDLKKTLGKKLRFSAYIEGISKTGTPFRNNKDLYKVRIGKKVTGISSNAFKGCISLTKISIPSSVTEIESSAFDECKSLCEITIPSSITQISSSCFRSCSSLSEITIPSSVTSIQSNAFRMCTSLRQITIPSSVNRISDHAFFGCSSLTQITIPSSVTSIENHTFSECSSLSQITIPSSITSIGEFAFDKCSSLSRINIPSSVTRIGDFAFANCKSLTVITIPSSVTSMGGGALFLSKNLREVTMPASLSYKGSLPSNARIIRT